MQAKKDEEEKYIERELAEYNKHKSQIKSAVAANNYKLDNEYKNKLGLAAKQMAESVRVGFSKV